MKLLRKILFPIVPIYYIVTSVRNKLYDLGWKSSKSYPIPVICVGNLSVGGTGKTPTIEYLIRLLKDNYKLATLSRGYKRETSGFIIADYNANAKTLGDEPFQFYQKFNDIIVSVDSNRQHGIEQLMLQEQPQVILLDDAYQHRKVKAGLNILLTAYDKLYSDDIVLPTGNLREPRSGAQRANLVIVTKCPKGLSNSEKQHIENKLHLLSDQILFFSEIVYSERVNNANGSVPLEELSENKMTLVTGIANPKPLVEYLNSKSIGFEHLKFQDHHVFSASEIVMLQEKECILTTEKDYMRLKDEFGTNNSQLYYLPIAFQLDDENKFNNTIKSFVDSSLQKP